MNKKFEQLLQQMPVERQNRIMARAGEIRDEYYVIRSLQDLRKALELTQVELAKQLGIRQAAVSKIESQTDMYISTLRRIIEALGGQLHIRASFPNDAEYEIEQFSSHIHDVSKVAEPRGV